MQGNNCILDANAVLRFLLQDNEEQFRQIKEIIRGKNCYVTLEVLAEVCYVFGRCISGYEGRYCS